MACWTGCTRSRKPTARPGRKPSPRTLSPRHHDPPPVQRNTSPARTDHGMTGYEEWSRAGWAAHLPGVTDIPAHVAGLGEATIPGLAAASADRVPDRIAAWLAARVDPGDRVLLAARSSLGFARCYLGALRAGAVVVLANPAYTAA